MIKALKKVGIKWMSFNIIKATYDTLIANMILNGEKYKPFPLMSTMRQICPLHPLIFNIVLDSQDRAIWQEKQMIEILIGTEEIKLSILGKNMILYLKHNKKLTKKSCT
jgi:hypothetical protein